MAAGLGRVFRICKSLLTTIQRSGVESELAHRTPRVICGPCSRIQFSTGGTDLSEEKMKTYDPPSPYRNPGPRRFGYEMKMHKGGLLPRVATAQSVNMPRYEPRDSWNRKRALFGQNDYIDILGDGDVKPSDLLKGPRWLLGFKGNELQRISRQLKFEGQKLSYLYPTEHNNLRKRVKYLYKRFNHKRSNYHR